MSNTSYTRTPGIMLGNTDVADKFLFESKKDIAFIMQQLQHLCTVCTEFLQGM